MEQKNIATWDEVQTAKQTTYVKFQDADKLTGIPVEQTFAVKNWQLFWSEEKDFNDKTKTVKKIKFQCDVVGEDGKIVQKKISNSSSRFINAIKPVLKDKKPESIVFVTVTKLGTGTATSYYVKEAKPTVLEN